MLGNYQIIHEMREFANYFTSTYTDWLKKRQSKQG